MLRGHHTDFATARIVNIVAGETTLLFDSMDRVSLIRQLHRDRYGFPELPYDSGFCGADVCDSQIAQFPCSENLLNWRGRVEKTLLAEVAF
jgi:hypothetical protein